MKSYSKIINYRDTTHIITRKDVSEFLKLAQKMRIKPVVQEYPLAEANRCLMELKTKRVLGARVLRIE